MLTLGPLQEIVVFGSTGIALLIYGVLPPDHSGPVPSWFNAVFSGAITFVLGALLLNVLELLGVVGGAA
jgi:hypothetical protein